MKLLFLLNKVQQSVSNITGVSENGAGGAISRQSLKGMVSSITNASVIIYLCCSDNANTCESIFKVFLKIKETH